MIPHFEQLLAILKDLRKDNEHGGQLYLEINPHDACYESMEEYLENPHDDKMDDEELSRLERCKEEKVLVTLRVYPCYSSSFIKTFAPTLEECAQDMVESLLHHGYVIIDGEYKKIEENKYIEYQNEKE